VRVTSVERDPDGLRTVHLRTDAGAAAACPDCEVFSTWVRQRRTTRPRDLSQREAPLQVRWHKTHFTCRQRLCSRKAFTESIAELPPRARITSRTRRAVAVAVGSGRSVVAVTRDLAMSWPTAPAAFVSHADRLLVEPDAPGVLGIDETRRGRPRWTRGGDGTWSRLERFETNFVDLSGPGGLLGQTAGRTCKGVVDWLEARGEQWKAQVHVVVIDMGSPYRFAVQQALPEALARLTETFAADDPTGEIGAAWGVKERLDAAGHQRPAQQRRGPAPLPPDRPRRRLARGHPARSDPQRLVAPDPRVPRHPTRRTAATRQLTRRPCTYAPNGEAGNHADRFGLPTAHQR